jgi:hypothetical protein
MEEEIVFCYKGYKELIVDGGSENKALVMDLIVKFGIQRKVTSTYYL